MNGLIYQHHSTPWSHQTDIISLVDKIRELMMCLHKFISPDSCVLNVRILSYIYMAKSPILHTV